MLPQTPLTAFQLLSDRLDRNWASLEMAKAKVGHVPFMMN